MCDTNPTINDYNATKLKTVHTCIYYYAIYTDPPAIAGSEVQQPFPFQIGLSYDIITCGLNSNSEPMVDGNPFPSISWSINGTIITNNSAKYVINNTNLIVRDISRNDAGVYNCTAVNTLGFDTIIYDVETYGKFIMNKIYTAKIKLKLIY